MRQLKPVGADCVERPQRTVKRGKQPQAVLREPQFCRRERFRLQIFIGQPIIRQNRGYAARVCPVLVERRRPQRDRRTGLQDALQLKRRLGTQGRGERFRLLQIARRAYFSLGIKILSWGIPPSSPLYPKLRGLASIAILPKSAGYAKIKNMEKRKRRIRHDESAGEC